MQEPFFAHEESDDPDGCLLTEKEVAGKLGVPQRTLRELRNRGDGPPYYELSDRIIRYRPSEVDAWLECMQRGITRKAALQVYLADNEEFQLLQKDQDALMMVIETLLARMLGKGSKGKGARPVPVGGES